MNFGHLLRTLACCLLLLVPAVVLADFPPVQSFPDTGLYQARALGDKRDVAVIQLSGNYHRVTPQGQPNVEPRTVIAKEFYRTHPDNFDFIVVFSNFEFETGDALAFHLGVQNHVKGLGLAEFDNTARFGSAGKLKGYIDMAALSRYVTNPYDPGFDRVLQTFSHEFLHQWGSHVRLKGAGGSLSNDLLGRDGSHWSFLLDSGASLHYGSQWRDNGDGTFTAMANRQFFSPLDLYLMGLYQASEVPPFYLIDNTAIDKTRTPQNDVTISGTRRNLSIQDVIAAEGARIPDAASSQKEFRIGFVLLTRDGDSTSDAQIAAINNIRRAIQTRIGVLTGGRALVQSYLESKTAATGSNDPVSHPRTDGVNLGDGFAWLRNRQGSEGNWVDNPFTAVRDSVAALDTLGELDGTSFTGRQRALDWLNAQQYSNTDYLARRLRSVMLARQDASADATRLLALQNADGGWGVAPGYQSSALDTALAMQALQGQANPGANAAALAAGTAYLLAQQNADGGWGNLAGGVSRTSVSATVLQVLVTQQVSAAVRERVVTFLAGRQNADGGFGDSPSTVHDTAQVVLALVAQNGLPAIRPDAAFSYVAAAQQRDGSWDGSVFSTALALRLLKSGGLVNWRLDELKAGPASPVDGQQVVLGLKISNSSTSPAGASVVRVFDGDPQQGGTQIGNDLDLPALLAGESIELKLLWNTFNKAGNHQIVAIVDPDNRTQESSKSDNRMTLAVPVAVAPAAIELLLNASDISVNPQQPARLPSVLAISALVANIGRFDAGAVRVVLREGAGAGGKILDQQSVNLLGRSSQVVNFSTTLAKAGSTIYSVQIDPDNQITEGDKSNNLAQVTVTTTPALDLLVKQDEIRLPPTVLYRGSDAVFKLTLRNGGTQDSPPFTVRYVVESGGNAQELASRTVQLAAGASLEQEVQWRADLAGPAVFKVMLDPDRILQESDRTNNSASLPFDVVDASGVNLATDFHDFAFSPLPARAGAPLQMTQVVRNSGTLAAQNVEVAFFDGDPQAGRMIGSLQTIASLAPGAQVTVQGNWPSFPDGNEHVIFFVVDPNRQQTEITRDDNTAFQRVAALGLPDLAVSGADLQFAPAAPRPGDALRVTATVSNTGQQAAANVLVRILDADPAQGGKPLAADQTLATLAAGASQALSFDLPARQANGTQTVVLVLDPDNRIAELRKDNNLARREVLVQSGDLYLSNRYFSPNGDGVLDDTSLGFRLNSVQDVTVVVLNAAGKIVRSFSDASLQQTSGGVVRWDGLSQRGTLVPDGDYRLRLLATSGAVLGEALVALDTNRASLLAAIDTPYEHFTNLSCQMSRPLWPDLLRVTSDEERVYLYNHNGIGHNHYRETATASELTALLPPELAQSSSLETWAAMSPNGEKLVYTRHVGEWPQIRQELWVINGDGSNLKLMKSGAGNSWAFITGMTDLNRDGSSLIVKAGAQLQKIPTDGVSAETVLFDAGNGNIKRFSLSPDRQHVLLEVEEQDALVWHVVSVATAEQHRMPLTLPAGAEFATYAWAPNSRLLALAATQQQLHLPGANNNDARLYVFDEKFNLRHTLDTAVGDGPPVDDYPYSSVGRLSWSAQSDELVFGFSYCNVNCGAPEFAPSPAGDGKGVAGPDGNQHVMLRADLVENRLEMVESTRVRFRWGNSQVASYLWVPNERSIVRYQDCYYGEGDCVSAVMLDEGNRLQPLFTNWHNAPDVRSSPAARMRVQGLLPSGHKLMFLSSRARLDSTSSCYGKSSGQYMFGSLQNLTADLQVLRSPLEGALIVRGTASDQNFARYRIDYASAAAPNDWKSVTPGVSTPQVDSVFTNWVPPAYGAWWLRLTVEDLAGNRREQIRRVNWSDTPAITDLYKDVEFISPNGDGVQDEVKLHYRVLEPVHLEFLVLGKDNQPLRRVLRDHTAAGDEATFVWDGRDDRGNLVADGQYRISVQNAEFFVTLDNSLPLAGLQLANAWSHAAAEGVGEVVQVAPALNWKAADANFNTMLLERGQGANPQDWQDRGRYPALAQSGSVPLTLDELVDMSYRLSVTDKAGNRVALTTAAAEQQIFLIESANHQRSNGGGSNWLGATPAPYRLAASLGQLPRIDGLAGNVPVRLTFAESVVKPLSKVVLQYREMQAADNALPLAGLDALDWTELPVTQFVSFNPASLEWVSAPQAANHQFSLLWDLQGVKPQRDYLMRLMVQDQDGLKVAAMLPYRLRLQNLLSLRTLQDERPASFRVNASVLWDQPVNRVELLVSSPDDPRYLQEQVIDTRSAPNGDYQHFLGQQRLQELDLRICGNYVLRLRAVMASGTVAYSSPMPVSARCFGVNWQASPQTVQACDAAPAQKIDVRLKPYANDGRRLTQMLLGQTLSGGREDILNNWNNPGNGQEYLFQIDTALLPDGVKPYFVRVKNEDGKEITVPLALEIRHQAASARITFPASGQKLCGIKAADPRFPHDTTRQVNVVAIEGAIESDGPVSYGLEFASAANGGNWQTFSPQGLPVNLAGFAGLRQGIEHLDPAPAELPFPCAYEDTRLCFDFHPLQWTASAAAKDGHFPGVPAPRGELGRFGLLESVEGEVSVRLRVFDAAGHQRCSAPVAFELDNKVRVAPATVQNRLFSPNAAAPRNVASVLLQADEAVSVDAELFATEKVAGEVRTLGLVRTLAHGLQLAAGSTTLTWDGQGDGAASLPDGSYMLRLRYTDGCGNTVLENQLLELDATAPLLTLSSPQANAVTGLIVPVTGRVRDAHFAGYAIEYALAQTPDLWLPLAQGEQGTPDNGAEQVLLNWNTLGLAGAVSLRVRALDQAGNQSVLTLPLQIAARSDLIAYLVAAPAVFSPNGDQQQDNTAVRFSLLLPGTVRLEVLRGSKDGPLVKTLIADEVMAAGAASRSWDGLSNLAQREVDGELVLKLSVTASALPGFTQEAFASLTLDTTPPQLTLAFPQGEVVKPQGMVSFQLAEAHLQGWQAALASNAGNPANLNWAPLAEGNSAEGAAHVLALEGLAEGKYGVKLQAVDTAGNRSELVKLFEIDRTAPKLAFTAPLAGTHVSARNGALLLGATLEEKNLAQYRLSYTLAGTPATAVELLRGTRLSQPALAYNWDAASLLQLPDGPLQLSLQADDLAGNSSLTQLALVLDNTLPQAAILSPANGSYLRQPQDMTGIALDANLAEYRLEIAPGSKAEAARWSLLASGTQGVNGGVLQKLAALPAEGVHTLRLTVTDRAGNHSEAFSEVVIDTRPPAAPLALQGQLENRSDVRLWWTAGSERDLAGYAVYRNGSRINQALLTEPRYLDTGLPNGSYVYQIKAIDQAGWESSFSNDVTLQVSTSAPQARLSSPQADGLVAGLLDVKGTAGAGKDFKEYRLFVGAGSAPADWQLLRRSPVPVQGDVLASWNSIGLPENAVYTLKLEAEDLFGTVASDRVSVTVDNTPPAAPLQLQAQANGAQVRLSWSASPSADVAGYILYRDERVANATGAVVGSLKPYLLLATNYADLDTPDGNHRYVVQAMDRAENLSLNSNTVTVLVDTRPPHAGMQQPLDNARLGGRTVLLAGSPDTDIATVQFQLMAVGSGVWQNLGTVPGKAPYSLSWDSATLPYGDYLLRAVATDVQGQVDPAPEAIRVSIVDRQAPDAVSDLAARVSGGDVSLHWHSDAPDLAGYVLERQLGTGAWLGRELSIAQAQAFVDTGLADGRYQYRVIAVDASGNRSAASAPVTALVYAPQVPQPYTPVRTASVTLGGQSPQSGKLTLLQETDEAPAVTLERDVLANQPFALDNLALLPGENRFSLSVLDADGNRSRTRQFHVVRTDPPAMPQGLDAGIEGSNVVLTWQANTEPDLLGYRVWRNGVPLQPETRVMATDILASTESDYTWSGAVQDDDADTTWSPAAEVPVKGQWLTLGYDQPQTVSRVQVNWDVAGVVADFDIEARDGDSWVPLARIRNNAAPQVDVRLEQAYRSDALRVVLQDARGNVPQLAELRVFVLPHQELNEELFADLVGAQDFGVQAVNQAGMVSDIASLHFDTGAPERADLAISAEDIVFSAASAQAGDSISVHATLHNAGKAAASNVEVVMTLAAPQGEAQTLLRQVVPTLAAGASMEVSAGFVAQTSGAYAVSVTLDAASQVDETDESNNSASRSISVAALPVVHVPVILGPTRAGLPLQVVQADTDILGFADPGAEVSLLRSGAPEDVTQASSAVSWRDISLQSDARSFHVSADGRRLLSGGRVLEIIEVDSGNRSMLSNVTDVNLVRSSPDGKMIAYVNRDAATWQQMLSVYDEATQTTRLYDSAALEPSALAWSNDGTQLAAVGTDFQAGQGLLVFDRQQATSRLLVAGVPWQFGSDLAWSGDGRYLAFVQDNVLKLADSSSGDIIYTHASPDPDFPSASSNMPSWSADGTHLIYQFAGANGETRIGEFDLASRSFRSLSGAGSSRSSPLWLGSDGSYSAVEGGQLQWRAHDGSLLQVLLPQLQGSNGMISTAGGQLYLRGYGSSVTLLVPAGAFRFAQVRLNPGRNEFAVWARNPALPALPHSAVSAPVQITRGALPLPDLVATSDAIVLLPATPLAGESARISLQVHNAGNAAASAVGVVLTLSDPQGAITTLHSSTLAQLAAGETRTLVLDWVPASSGRHVLALSLDSAARVSEANEANNVGVRTVEVAASSLPTISATLDRAGYAANSALRARIRLANAGGAFSGSVLISIRDANGDVVDTLPAQIVAQLAHGQTLDLNANWNTALVLAGDYRLQALLRNTAGQTVASSEAAFVILPSRQLAASLQLERNLYRPQQDVNLAATISLEQANSTLAQATSVLRILDSSQRVVFERIEPLVSMLPGTALGINALWNTGSSAAGQYQAQLEVRLGNTLLASSEAGFEIQPELIARVGGSLSLSSVLLGNGERLTAAWSVQNTGSLALAGVPLLVAIVDPASLDGNSNPQVIASARSSADLAVGAQVQGQAGFDVQNWPLKPLQAVFSAQVAGNTVVLQRVSLRVTDRIPPQVRFVAPVAGALIAGESLSVQVRASDADSRLERVELDDGSGQWQTLAPVNPAQGLYGVMLPAGADGVHHLRARATDVLGNVSEVVELNVEVDNTAPTIDITGVENGGSHASPAMPVIRITDAHAFTSIMMVNEMPYVAGQPLPGPGSYLLEIIATDILGNVARQVLKFDVDEGGAGGTGGVAPPPVKGK